MATAILLRGITILQIDHYTALGQYTVKNGNICSYFLSFYFNKKYRTKNEPNGQYIMKISAV
jgi:hypothetical protein